MFDYKKLLNAKKEFEDIVKTKAVNVLNKSGIYFTKYKYADLEACFDAIDLALHNNGLILLQPIIDNMLETKLIDAESGDFIVIGRGEIISAQIANTTSIQAWGGGVSYLRRYQLLSGLGVATEDEDGVNATDPRVNYKSKIEYKPQVMNSDDLVLDTSLRSELNKKWLRIQDKVIDKKIIDGFNEFFNGNPKKLSLPAMTSRLEKLIEELAEVK